MRFDKPWIFILGGGRGLQSNKVEATTSTQIRRLSVQLSPCWDPKSIPAAPQVPPAPQTWCSHPTHGLWGGSPSSFPSQRAAQTWPQTPAAQPSSGDTDTPKHTTSEFSLLFLQGITGEASAAEGTGKETAQLERCLRFSCLTSPRSHRNARPSFQKKFYTLQQPLPHFQTVHRPSAR